MERPRGRSKSWGVLVVALSSILLGCSGYRPALLPSDPIPKSSRGEVHVVQVGSQVRVKTQLGRTVEGEVVELDGTSLSVEQSGNYGYGRVEVPLSHIDSIETGYVSKDEKVLWGGLAVVVALGVVLAYSPQLIWSN